jgi:hypothetical protein
MVGQRQKKQIKKLKQLLVQGLLNLWLKIVQLIFETIYYELNLNKITF